MLVLVHDIFVSLLIGQMKGIIMLDHEKLDVYKCSVEFLALAFTLIKDLPRGYGLISDHLKRSSLSIPFNIAEGVGKMSPADKEKFFAIARGSAMECASVLDACSVLKLISHDTFDEGKTLLTRIVFMLTKMCSF